MADFSAKDVQKLRQESGAGMMDAKKALTENAGDYTKALQWLREKGMAGAAKRADRENTEGAVAVSITDSGAAIVELKCETDFVAKNADFVNLVNELANLVAQKGDAAVEEKKGEIEELNVSLKENIQLGRVVRFEGPAEGGRVRDSYLHVQADRGVNAVLVELEGGSQELAHDIAVHIAFARPQYLAVEDVPAEEVEQQRKTFEAISRNEGKPEAALPKIIEGRLQGFYKDVVLAQQPYAKDEKQSIAQLLGEAKITRFSQVVIGS
jgi:elongation factor Ts